MSNAQVHATDPLSAPPAVLLLLSAVEAQVVVLQAALPMEAKLK